MKNETFIRHSRANWKVKKLRQHIFSLIKIVFHKFLRDRRPMYAELFRDDNVKFYAFSSQQALWRSLVSRVIILKQEHFQWKSSSWIFLRNWNNLPNLDNFLKEKSFFFNYEDNFIKESQSNWDVLVTILGMQHYNNQLCGGLKIILKTSWIS